MEAAEQAQSDAESSPTALAGRCAAARPGVELRHVHE